MLKKRMPAGESQREIRRRRDRTVPGCSSRRLPPDVNRPDTGLVPGRESGLT